VARVWEAASGKEVLTLDGHTAIPNIAASTPALLSSVLCPKPLLAASALYPGRMGHKLGVLAVAVTPNGKRLITADHDNLIMLWDAASGRQLRCWVGGGWVDRGIFSVAVTPDGKRLLTAGADGAAAL
jgi:WD40 repeat protein